MILRKLFALSVLVSMSTAGQAQVAGEESSGDGVSTEIAYTGDYVYVVEGGIEQKGVYLGNLDLVLNVNFEKKFGWKGLSAKFYLLGNHGEDPTEIIGDSLVSSNIESPEDYIKVYEAWIQQEIGNSMSILFGMHDLNSEFYATDSSGSFLNSNFGIGIDLAQTGENGPSIFPQTAPALRVALKPTENIEFRVAAYNARAGNPESVRQTYARYDSDDGLLNIGELTYFLAEKGKVAIGGWSYTKKVDRLDGQGMESNQGAYGLLDLVWNENISIFMRYGAATKEVNSVASSLAAGALLKSLSPARPNDSLGLALTSVEPSSIIGDAAKAEQVLELTYEAVLSDNLTIQPDLQLIKSPSFDETADDVVVMTVRWGLKF